MKLIRKIDPPFETVEEVIAFINKHGENTFVQIVIKYQQSLCMTYMRYMAIFFPIYIGLSSIVLLFDYKEINYATGKILEFFYIPVRNPYGWNVSLILSAVMQILAFSLAIRTHDFSLLRKVTKLRISFKYIVRNIMLFLCMLGSVFAAYSLTLTKQAETCTLLTACFLYSDNMFLDSSFTLYVTFFLVIVFAYCILYGCRFGEDFDVIYVEDMLKYSKNILK